MKKMWLILIAMGCFLVAPALAQDGDAGDSGAGAATNTTEDSANDGAIGVEGGLPAEALDPDLVGTFWNYSTFDNDGNGFLTMDEFSDTLYNFVAENPAQGIDEDRFEAAVTNLGLDPAEHEFEATDLNQDERVSSDQEFAPGVAAGVFEEWDQDGDAQLSEEEFRASMFGVVDANVDGIIDANEFQPFADWFNVDFEQVAPEGGGITMDSFMPGEQLAAPGDDGGVAGGGAGDDGTGEDDGAGGENTGESETDDDADDKDDTEEGYETESR